MSNDTKAIIAATISAAATTAVFWAIYDYFSNKKLKRNNISNEQAWLQNIADDLKAGKFASFDPEFVAKLNAIITPLQDRGLLK